VWEIYKEIFTEMLAPMGVYRLDENSISGAHIAALGAGFDLTAEQLDRTV